MLDDIPAKNSEQTLTRVNSSAQVPKAITAQGDARREEVAKFDGYFLGGS